MFIYIDIFYLCVNKKCLHMVQKLKNVRTISLGDIAPARVVFHLVRHIKFSFTSFVSVLILLSMIFYDILIFK